MTDVLKIFVLSVLLCCTLVSLNVTWANTSGGHITIAIDILIDMTENEGKYAGLDQSVLQQLKLKEGKSPYKINNKNLNSVQKSFILGCIAPDDQYTKGFENTAFVENLHYVDPKGRVDAILQKAKNETNSLKNQMDYAYAYGIMSHSISDRKIHPILPQFRQATDKERVEDGADVALELLGDITGVGTLGFPWMHITLEGQFDKKRLREELIEQKKIDEKDLQDLEDHFMNHIFLNMVQTTMKPPQPIDGYDVHGENNTYYLNIYRKCPQCQKILGIDENARTKEMNDHLKEMKASDTELKKYARYAIDSVNDYRKENPIKSKIFSISLGEVEKNAEIALKGSIEDRDTNKKKLDEALKYEAEVFGVPVLIPVLPSPIPIPISVKFPDTILGRINKKYFEKIVSELNLETYRNAHRNELNNGGLAQNEDLDDAQRLPTPYKPCSCQQQNDNDNKSDDPKNSGSGTHFISLKNNSAEIFETPECNKIKEVLAYGTPVSVEPSTNQKTAQITVQYGLLKGTTGYTLYNKKTQLALGTVKEDVVPNRPQTNGEGIVVTTTGIWDKNPLQGNPMNTSLRLKAGEKVLVISEILYDKKKPNNKFVKCQAMLEDDKTQECRIINGWIQLHKILAFGVGKINDTEEENKNGNENATENKNETENENKEENENGTEDKNKTENENGNRSNEEKEDSRPPKLLQIELVPDLTNAASLKRFPDEIIMDNVPTTTLPLTFKAIIDPGDTKRYEIRSVEWDFDGYIDLFDKGVRISYTSSKPTINTDSTVSYDIKITPLGGKHGRNKFVKAYLTYFDKTKPSSDSNPMYPWIQGDSSTSSSTSNTTSTSSKDRDEDSSSGSTSSTGSATSSSDSSGESSSVSGSDSNYERKVNPLFPKDAIAEKTFTLYFDKFGRDKEVVPEKSVNWFHYWAANNDNACNYQFGFSNNRDAYAEREIGGAPVIIQYNNAESNQGDKFGVKMVFSYGDDYRRIELYDQAALSYKEDGFLIPAAEITLPKESDEYSDVTVTVSLPQQIFQPVELYGVLNVKTALDYAMNESYIENFENDKIWMRSHGFPFLPKTGNSATEKDYIETWKKVIRAGYLNRLAAGSPLRHDESLKGECHPENDFANPQSPQSKILNDLKTETQCDCETPPKFEDITGVYMYNDKKWTRITAEVLKNKPYNVDADSVIIIHGNSNTYEEPWITKMAETIKQQEPQKNVFQISWGEWAKSVTAVSSAAHISEVAEKGHDILFNCMGLLPERTHFIGHSHGSHIAGKIGTKTQGKVKRITCLDPSDELVHLIADKGSNQWTPKNAAAFVDSYKSSKIFGAEGTFGIDNFFLVDPKDTIGLDLTGNHSYAHQWFTETIRNTQTKYGYQWNKDSWNKELVTLVNPDGSRESMGIKTPNLPWKGVLQNNDNGIPVLQGWDMRNDKSKYKAEYWRYPGTWQNSYGTNGVTFGTVMDNEKFLNDVLGNNLRTMIKELASTEDMKDDEALQDAVYDILKEFISNKIKEKAINTAIEYAEKNKSVEKIEKEVIEYIEKNLSKFPKLKMILENANGPVKAAILVYGVYKLYQSCVSDEMSKPNPYHFDAMVELEGKMDSAERNKIENEKFVAGKDIPIQFQVTNNADNCAVSKASRVSGQMTWRQECGIYFWLSEVPPNPNYGVNQVSESNKTPAFEPVTNQKILLNRKNIVVDSSRYSLGHTPVFENNNPYAIPFFDINEKHTFSTTLKLPSKKELLEEFNRDSGTFYITVDIGGIYKITEKGKDIFVEAEKSGDLYLQNNFITIKVKIIGAEIKPAR